MTQLLPVVELFMLAVLQKLILPLDIILTLWQDFTPGGSSELYHNYNKVFETTASGIDVTGHTETDTLNVSGISTLGTLKVNNDVNVVGVLTAERLYSNVLW